MKTQLFYTVKTAPQSGSPETGTAVCVIANNGDRYERLTA